MEFALKPGAELPPAPSADDVLGQHFDFKPTWWQKRVPDLSWTAWLDALPAGPEGRRTITRRDLLEAGTVSPQRALVAAYVWGTGDQPFVVPRRARVFAANDAEAIRSRLTVATDLLHGGGDDAVCSAYLAMSRGGPAWLKFLGPSFFTKVLYALDSRDLEPARALILDQFVAIALNDLCGTTISERGPWSATVYLAWLDFAREQAARLSNQSGLQVRTDSVEMALFRHGKAVADLRRRR